MLNIPSKSEFLLKTRRALAVFRLNWKQFLGIHIVVNGLSLLVLTPLLAVVLGWIVLASGQTALTDEDILFFVLSPTGMLLMILAGGLYTTIVVFQQAAMVTAAFYASTGAAMTNARLGRYMLMKFWPLFRLATQMVGRTVLIAAPFLAVSAWIYFSFLNEFDINYYIATKPPVLWRAGGAMLLCALALIIVLLRVFSGWVLALPLLLINEESPFRVLAESRKASKFVRLPIALILLTLFVFNAGLLGIVSAMSDVFVNGMVKLAGESLQLMAYLLGAVLLAWLLVNVAITFFSNSLLSLVIISFFTRLISSPVQQEPIAAVNPTAPKKAWKLSGIKLAVITLILVLAGSLVTSIVINRLSMEDHTLVIAHRGASNDAPENTLAAMKLAINQGADWVEIDVQETRDGEVVVIHDIDLKKIADSDLRVFESSLTQIQSLDIGSWNDTSFKDQRIATLQQLLELCKDRIKVLIELKYYGQEKRLEERVANIVEAAGMQDQIMVMSLSYPGIQKMRELRPAWKLGLLASVAIGDITRLDADFLAVNAKFASRRFIKRVHNRGKSVLVWTINDPISMSAMMSKGVDGIITDKPELAAKIRQDRADLSVHERIMIQLASLIGKQPTRPEQ